LDYAGGPILGHLFGMAFLHGLIVRQQLKLLLDEDKATDHVNQ
jgi:hypothetical protein